MVCQLMSMTALDGAHGGGMHGRPGPTPGLECIFDALPRGKRGDLRGHHQREIDHDHRLIPPALHLGSLTGLGGGLDKLPVPISHIVRGPQRRHWKIPESMQPAGR